MKIFALLYIFIFIKIISCSNNLIVVFATEDPQQNETLYNNSEVSQNFMRTNKQCCTPPNLTKVQNQSALIFSSDIINTTNITVIGAAQIISCQTTESQKLEQYLSNITCQCGNGPQAQYTSAMIRVDLITQNVHVEFYYWYLCSQSAESVYIFDWTLTLQILLIVLLILIFSIFGRISAYNIKVRASHFWFAGANQLSKNAYMYFQGFNVTYILVIIYVIFEMIAEFVMEVQKNDHDQIENSNLSVIASLIVVSLLAYNQINETLCFLPADLRLKTQIYKKIRVCDVLSLIITIILAVLYFLYRTWYLSDILAIAALGTLMKIFKITSLKNATILYAFCIIWDSIFFTYVNLKKNIFNYQILPLQYLNFPWLIEFPLISFTYLRICSFISIENIFLPGWVISYLYRYDCSHNSNIFMIIGYIGLILGFLAWTFLSAYLSKTQQSVLIPQSYFVFPTIIFGVLIYSIKLGVFKIIWHGDFHDRRILDLSIEFEQQNQGIDYKRQEIDKFDQQIFQELIINKSETQ